MKMSKYFAIFRIQITNRGIYLGDLAAQSLTIVMFMWIFMQLWRTTYAIQGNEIISGLTLKDTLWYLMFAEVIMLSKPRILREISQSVKDGSIAYLINKPYHFILYQASVGMGDLLIYAIFNLIAGSLTVWFLVGSPPAPTGIFIAAVPFFLAWTIDFLINVLIGLSAFVIEEVAAFEWVYSKLLLLLGGVLIPLDFFPAWLRELTSFLPFANTIYGPARLFIDPTSTRLTSLLFTQGIWVITLSGFVLFFYKRGMRRLAINGG
jgi:ABC-2 type transport system permease protein